MKLARFVVVPAILLALSTVLPACQGTEGAKSAQVKPGDMPEGESFTGVYFHPVYGYLHLVEDGSNVFGKWMRADQSHWGEMQGAKTGNVLHFTWKDHTIGLVGAGAESKGKGYFQYKMGKDVAELDGQFGLNDDETGADWHNVKQQRKVPDLKSIPGDTDATSTPTGESWQ